MDVKKANPIDTIREILNQQNGILYTSDLARHHIARTYLSHLEALGEIHRVSRGIYSASDALVDEMVAIQARFKNAIFSHQTAAYLLDLTDRSPLSYTVTVPAGYNATSLKAAGLRVFYIRRGLHTLGMIRLKTPHGNEIKTYDLQRTICDLLRNRNQLDVQQINEALRWYVKKKDIDLNQLHTYAGKLGIQKIVREYIEILL